jgi:hypothetical protein
MMEFFRRKAPPPPPPTLPDPTLHAIAEAVGDALIAAKDEKIKEATAALEEQRKETKDSRVRLNLVMRAGERFRRAVEIAGARYEEAADGVSRELTGQD